MLTQVAEWTPATLLSLGARNATRLLPFNLVITNVPGPQVPLYLLGAKMEQIYPYVPLADNLGLGIALFSYDGTLAWGFNADYELVPDLDQFVQAIRDFLPGAARGCGRRERRAQEEEARAFRQGLPGQRRQRTFPG